MLLYEYARPDLMAGKKILYVHGFASGGNSGTVKTLKTLLPAAEIIAPDLPIDPKDAMALLEAICKESEPSLIIGTSMGGMYAEQLAGHYRILVNPAFTLADTILKNNGLGRHNFHTERKDGETSFLVTKGLIEDFRTATNNCFKQIEDDKVYGLFGIHDNMVDTFGIFAEHYSHAIRFDGEHYMNDKAVLHSVLPVIQWIDDIQENRSRKTLLIGLEDTLADLKGEIPSPGQFSGAEPVINAVRSFASLAQWYDVYVVASVDYNHPELYSEMKEWIETHLGVPAWNKIIFSARKDLIYGDYLLARHISQEETDNFLGTTLRFGTDPFKTWDETVTYFERLGGQ